MSTSLICPQCNSPVPADAPQGICPRCLLRAGLASDSLAGDPSVAATAGPDGRFEPPAVDELRRLFPQLEILELLGQGGMGAVYKVRQPGLDRLAALKILPPQVGRDAAFAERFKREARALAKLSHPGIVGVFDFGQTGSLCWILMEYVDGADLRRAMKCSLSPAEALAIVPQICDALQYAHDEGVVHRDIKPENVLLDRRGRVKIADFGLAKLLSRELPAPSLTVARQVMGTPRYMAPEQMEGSEQVDHRADIYSLGVVFYELLTGEAPAGRFPPPSQKARIDVRLDEVVLRSLEREPERRWQQASQIKSQLSFIADRPAVAPGTANSGKPAPSLEPGERVEIAMRNLPQDATDLFCVLGAAFVVLAIFFAAPAFLAYCLSLPFFDDPLRSRFLAVYVGVGTVLGLFVILGLGSIAGATVDGAGIVLQRFAGPSKFLSWTDVLRVRPISRWEVVRQVVLWPGLPPRGSIISMTCRGWYRIDTTDGCWYFCPADAERFRSAVGLSRSAESSSNEPQATNRWAEHEVGRGADARAFDPVATTGGLSFGVYVIAVVNLFTAVVLMFAIGGDPEPNWIPESAAPAWRSWETVSTYLAYALYSMTLLAGVGMLLRQPWGRSLTVGTCWASLAMLVTDIPYVARFYFPLSYEEIVSEMAAEGMAPAEAEFNAGLFVLAVYAGMFAVTLSWLLFQAVYLSRRKIVAQFDGPAGQRTNAFSQALVWAPAVGLLTAGGVAYAIMLAVL